MPKMINRREDERHHRRLQVRFWASGEERSHHGFTSNLSRTGAFVAAQHTLPRGGRLRMELKHGDGTVVVEALVMHSYHVPPALRALGTSGMGVRFLSPEEVLAPLLGAEEAPAAAPQSSSGAEGATGTGYPVRFDSAAKFLQSYHRDLVNGGIFVLTSRPGRLHETVRLDFHLPPPATRVVRARGQVVQVMEPRPTPTGKSGGGMGVEISDLPALLETLAPHVERMEKRTAAG